MGLKLMFGLQEPLLMKFLVLKIPSILDVLIKSMLLKNPDKRLSAEEAATICQIILWAPKSWTADTSSAPPSSQDILQWLLAMTTKSIYECRFFNKPLAHL